MADTVTKRNYIPLATVQAQTAAADLTDLDFAEQVLDNYVGHQDKAVEGNYQGQITSLLTKTVIDTNSSTQLNVTDDYFKYCVIEMLSGNAAGEIRPIISSSKDNKSVTLKDDWTTTPAVGDYFKVYQFGKFPRQCDSTNNPSGTTFLKTIPQAVKDALIAQVAFQAQMGDAYFAGDDSDKESESIGNYSYSRGSGSASSSVKMLAPKARMLLRGIKNSLGRLVV